MKKDIILFPWLNNALLCMKSHKTSAYCSFTPRNTRKLLHIVSLGCAVALFCSGITGCKKEDSANSTSMPDSVSFPLKKPITLKYWTNYSPTNTSTKNDGSGNYWDMYAELEKRTGVKIDFIFPVSGNANEQLNLLLASRDLPDIIESDLKIYSGGTQKAYEDKLILELSDLQKKYAPNLSKIYEKYPDVLSEVQTENGQYLCVPFIKGDDSLLISKGLMMRKDWLDDLNLKVPQTYTQLHDALKEFKDKKGATAPLVCFSGDISKQMFLSAGFGVIPDFFVENGKVKYGPADPRYKNYVAMLNQWYKEGILDKDFATNDPKTYDSKVLSGKSGAFYNAIGGIMKKYLQLANEKDPKFNLVGLPFPALNENEPVVFLNKGARSYGSTVITTSTKYPAESMAWLDYAFSKEGHMLFNFGVEGVSYTIENGYPKYTDLIMNNPEKQPMGTILGRYARSVNAAPFVQDPRYLEQYYNLPQQQEAVKTYNKYSKEVAKAKNVLYGNLTVQESSSIATKMTEIETYRDERFIKWIMGHESLDTFDNYLKKLDEFKIEEVIKIKQTAYDRFIAKFPNVLNTERSNINDFYTK